MDRLEHNLLLSVAVAFCMLFLSTLSPALHAADVSVTTANLCVSNLHSYDAGSTGERVSSADALFEHLCMTVLQQSHLCPVPLENQSVYWQYDHALHLYPAPDLVVLADSAASAQFTFKDTACVNPVSS